MMRRITPLILALTFAATSISSIFVSAALPLPSSSHPAVITDISPLLRYRGGRQQKQKKHGWVPGQGQKIKSTTYIDKLFDSVDKDHDGGVSIDELYERVLLMYIRINQQANVPPPTRETVTALFRNADTNRSNRLDREQFRHIMLVIYSRAATRMVLAKISKVVLAPLLAVQTVRYASCSGCWWEQHVAAKIPERYEMLLDANVWRTVLTVLFIITLSNAIVGATTAILDGLCGVDKRKEEVDL